MVLQNGFALKLFYGVALIKLQLMRMQINDYAEGSVVSGCTCFLYLQQLGRHTHIHTHAWTSGKKEYQHLCNRKTAEKNI